MSAPYPCLYILMRTDMASLNPGKAMAQATHAANNFQTTMDERGSYDYDAEFDAAYREWKNSTPQNFGTCIVLSIDSEEALFNANMDAGKNGIPSNVIYDPGYPVKDGKVTHYINIATCGWMFGMNTDSDIRLIKKKYNLELHK